MTNTEAGEGVLIHQFKAFQAWLDGYMRTLAAAGAHDDAAPVPEPEAVRNELALSIDGFALDGTGRRAVENGRDLRYLMAACADERLIASGWAHQKRWVDYLVEDQLAGTRNAGDQVLDRIETLLRADDPERRELALPYLFALALGFRGRARANAEGEQLLASLRKRLFQMARNRDPDPGFGSAPDALDHNLARRVMHRPYTSVVSDAEPVLLPDPRRWIAWFLVAFGLMLLAAWLVWSLRTAELRAHFEDATPAQQSQGSAR